MLLVILFTKFEDSICRQPTDHSDGSVDVSMGANHFYEVKMTIPN